MFGTTFQNTVLARPVRNGGEQSYVSYMVDLHTYVSYITTSSVLGVSPGSIARPLQRTLRHGHARHLLFVRGGGHQDIACVRLRGCCASTCTVHMSFACNSTNNVSHAALASWYFTTAFFSVYRKQKGRQSNVLYNEVADGRRRRSERSGTPFRPAPFGTFRGNMKLSLWPQRGEVWFACACMHAVLI